MEIEYICRQKYASFGSLTIRGDIDEVLGIEFLMGDYEYTFMEKDEVVKLRDYLTDLINKYEGVVIADA